MKKLKVGATTIDVAHVSTQQMADLWPDRFEDDNVLLGIWSSIEQKIYVNKNQTPHQKFNTLIHEIGEFINDEYGLQMTHPQIQTFCKVMTDVLIQNKLKCEKDK